MKKNLLLFFFIPYCLLGQSLFISDSIVVSTEGTSTRAPRIALLEDNSPVIYWGKSGSNSALYLAIWDNTTAAFGDPISINTGSATADIWGGSLGPQIVTQGNTMFIVFENYGEGIYCGKSIDGGQTFADPVSVWDAPAGRVATLPSVAISPNGNPVVSFITTNFNEQEALYEVAKSNDGGLSFSLPAVANEVVDGTEVCECCMGSIVAPSEDEIYISFRNNDDNKRDIWIAQSLDGGSSFTNASDIDDTDWTTFSCPQSGPDMIVDGDNIYTTFFSATNGANIYFSALNKATMEAGNQFQIPALNGSNTSQNFPAIAGNSDTLGLVWQEIGDNGYDIVIAWSVNGLAGLEDQSTLVAGGTSSQKQADVVFKDGVFHIAYEDSSLGRVMYRTAGFEEIVSIADPQFDIFNFEITPNPVSEFSMVYFSNDKAEQITANLINTSGQVIKTYSTNSDRIKINKEGVSAGTYFLQLNTNQGTAIKKIVLLN